MNFIKRIGPGIVALTLCGGAAAHSISGDGWNGITTDPSGSTFLGGNGNTVTINSSVTANGTSLELPENISVAGISSLSFSPGTEFSSYDVATRVTNNPNDGSFFYAAADEWFWSSNSLPGAEAVSLTATSINGTPMLDNAPVLTISVGYGDADFAPPSCGNYCCDGSYSGETASVTVNGSTYTARNPCQLGAGTGDLTFVNGVLKAGSGIGWTESAATAAPEMHPASAGGGLTLLLGSLLVIRGRRTGLFRLSIGVEPRSGEIGGPCRMPVSSFVPAV